MERPWSEDELDLLGDFVSYWDLSVNQTITQEEVAWTTWQMNRIKRLRLWDQEWKGFVSPIDFAEPSVRHQFQVFPYIEPWTDLEMHYLAQYIPEREKKIPKSYTTIANEMSEHFKSWHRSEYSYTHQNIRTIMVRHFATITATPMTRDESIVVAARLPGKSHEYLMISYIGIADALNRHPMPPWVWDEVWGQRRPRRRFTAWGLKAWVLNRERQQLATQNRQQFLRQ
ncbi:hypothetical protein B7494_g3703 [Chlorociboria aeruginascens]|nr:hypothetical protein B7494_g3703 [Chlorociboria aeruginascens]